MESNAHASCWSKWSRYSLNRDQWAAFRGYIESIRDAGDQEGRLRTNRLNDLMMDRFSEANGSCLCNDLLGCDIRTPEGVQYARDNHLFTEFCPKMVASAVDILEGIIKERQGS